MSNEEILNQYQDMVWSILRNKGKASDPDSVQEAFLALFEAALRFDPDKGVKFSTYAHTCISKALIAYSHKDKVITDRRNKEGKYESAGFVDSLERNIGSDDDDSDTSLLETISGPGQFEEGSLDRMAWEYATQNLTEEERTIWDMKLKGASCSAIGEVIGKTTTTVERLLAKICLKVRRRYYGN